jgi:hypothetical protein
MTWKWFYVYMSEAKEWPGLHGSLDVMQWKWKNCTKAHRGVFQGKDGVATVALEAAVDCILWFWLAHMVWNASRC